MNASALWPVRHVTVSIDRPPAAVYEFAADPQNLPRWAKGLAGSITRVDDETWLAEAPMGKVKVRFADRNAFGVLDHDVTLESGETIHNPMRVLPNAGGSEVVFSLFRRPGITDAEFESDASAVARDLSALKALLEIRQVGSSAGEDR
jgi:hypothetical protein